MCQTLTPLAVSSDLRCLHRCEHGTIHLTWDVVTAYLDLETLTHVVEATGQGQALQAPGQLRCGPCQLFYTAKGHFQVWIGNVGFTLTRANFEILADMVRVALKEIVQPTVQGQPAEEIGAYQRTVKASARHMFSNN